MATNVIEGGSPFRLTATGTSVVTSGNCQVLGLMCAASVTQGSFQFFASTTSSNSLSPVIPVLTTGAFIRFPMIVSGAGLTIKYTGTLDPNLMLFWAPMGGP